MTTKTDANLAVCASDMLWWLERCEQYLMHPDVIEVTDYFNRPPNLSALHKLICDAREIV